MVYKRWSKSCTLPMSNSHLVKAQLTLLMIVDLDLVSGVCCQGGIRCHFTVCCQVPIYFVKGFPLMKRLDRTGWRWYCFLQSRTCTYLHYFLQPWSNCRSLPTEPLVKIFTSSPVWLKERERCVDIFIHSRVGGVDVVVGFVDS
jgi:hypothetical protein